MQHTMIRRGGRSVADESTAANVLHRLSESNDVGALEGWLDAPPVRAMQRTGKHYFIYPDAAKNRIFVGGPQEYAAYRKLHPEDNSIDRQRAQETAASAYRAKQDGAMEAATARDLSNPFLGLSWADLGW